MYVKRLVLVIETDYLLIITGGPVTSPCRFPRISRVVFHYISLYQENVCNIET